MYGLSTSPEEACRHRKLAPIEVAKVENDEQTWLSGCQCSGASAGAWPGSVAGSEWEHGGGTSLPRG